jgi:hypothetical protein
MDHCGMMHGGCRGIADSEAGHKPIQTWRTFYGPPSAEVDALDLQQSMVGSQARDSWLLIGARSQH